MTTPRVGCKPEAWQARRTQADRRRSQRAFGAYAVTVSVSALVALLGCEPKLTVGKWNCTDAPLTFPPDGSPEPQFRDRQVEADWATGFEDGFCGYQRARGYCYSDEDAGFEIVRSPTLSGRFAAAFTIDTDPDLVGNQVRCVRQGQLPKAAYYQASFYVPSGTTAAGNWNLMHFRGGDDVGGDLHGIWDVSLEVRGDGTLAPYLRAPFNNPVMNVAEDVELPTDTWVTLTFYWKRGTDSDGEVALYLDGDRVIHRSGFTTDDSFWGQWYIGNLASNLTPLKSTLYVDDVAILQELQ